MGKPTRRVVAARPCPTGTGRHSFARVSWQKLPLTQSSPHVLSRPAQTKDLHKSFTA